LSHREFHIDTKIEKNPSLTNRMKNENGEDETVATDGCQNTMDNNMNNDDTVKLCVDNTRVEMSFQNEVEWFNRNFPYSSCGESDDNESGTDDNLSCVNKNGNKGFEETE